MGERDSTNTVQLWQWWYLSRPPCNVPKHDQHMCVHLENRSLIQRLALMCSAISSSNYLILHGFGLAGSSFIGYEDGTRFQPWRSDGEHMGPSGLVGLEQLVWSGAVGVVNMLISQLHTCGLQVTKSWAGPGNEARIRVCEAFRVCRARAAMACL